MVRLAGWFVLVVSTVLAIGCADESAPATQTIPREDGEVVSGAGTSSEPSTERAHPQVLSFEGAEGWNTIATDIGRNSPWPVAWAANVPFQPEDAYAGIPSNTLRQLPAEGIVIVASGPRIYEGGTSFPRLDLPLRVQDGTFLSDGYETQPAPNVSRVLIDTWVGNKLINVTVWFGSNEPRPNLISSANSQLKRLTVPMG